MVVELVEEGKGAIAAEECAKALKCCWRAITKIKAGH